ncbi:MAG TPA: putative Ig domain-containing protein [Acidimicrobiia bacterium]
MRVRALVMVAALLATIFVVAGDPTTASAAGTVLFDNVFNDRTVDGNGTVTIPTPTSGPNVACLSAVGNTATPPLLSCAGATDAQGSGKLQLTPATTGKVGGVFGQTSFPTSNGLDVTFNSYQWGGTSADGIAFMLSAVDPANPVPPAAIGPSGGALGYSTAPGVNGLTNAYLGVGLDVFGNFSNSTYVGTGCTSIANFGTATPGVVVVRGPGNLKAGYCALATTYNGTPASKLTLRATTRAASVVPVEVLINPTASAFTGDSGVSVAAGSYKVVVTPVGQATKTLTGALPTVAGGVYPSSTWLNASGVPKQLVFGIVGSTGSVTDVHEVSNVKALTFNPVPQLSVTTTSSSAATSVAGDPVTYNVVPSVLAGSDETVPISVTQTTPTGVVPVGAFGTGWACAAPIGRSVTCTTTASSFTNGTVLSPIKVVAIATTTITAASVQSGSSAQVSSSDASPGTAATAAAGTVATAPTGVAVSPTLGLIAGGGALTVSGSNITGANAIEIGTTSEQQGGTPVTLLPCPGAAAAGCFTVSGSTLVISSMPARASAATVSVTVVTQGIAAAASYVYADKPATPAAPTATPGITSANVTWVAPAGNGGTISNYIVTPYLNTVAQTPITYNASTTTRTLTGLTPAASYTFTVAAVNTYGTSTASAQSVAVVPYTVPGTPSITAVSAGDVAATVTWTTPSNGGSAITGYVVTPYIGLVAQPTQTFSGGATTQTATGLTAGVAYTFTVAAQNLAGTGPASAKSSAVTPNVSPSLTFPAPPNGEVGVAYSRQLTVNDGTAPVAWSVSTGVLPIGVTLNASTGLLSGTPTVAGSYSFTVRVADASTGVATKAVTVTIAATPTLTFTPPSGEVGFGYSQQPALTGGTGPFAWSISAGSLPAGVTLNATTGLVSGSPTTAGSSSFTVAATDSFAQVASRTATIVVIAAPAFAPAAPPGGQVGVAYTGTLDVTGGVAPLAWSLTAGSLPSGLSLNTGTGTLSGTPTTVGSSSFTVSVIDANGLTASKSVTLVIGAGPLVITKSASGSSSVAGGTVAYTITVTNTGPTTWTGATLTDPLTGVLDDATYNANATASGGTVSYAAPAVTWSGNIAAGASVTIGYSVTVNNPDVGNKVLTDTVSSTTLGTNCAAGSGDARCSTTVNIAGLTIVKSADVATTTPGSTVHFSVVVTNTGPVSYPGATFTDSLAGALDDGAYNADGTATSGNVSYTSPSLTWVGNLGVGASATLTYSVTVADPDPGNRSLTGTIVSASAGSPCPSGNPASSCATTVTVLVPALAITTSASVSNSTPGSTVSYTMVLSNTGQTAYTGTSAKLGLSGVLDDATYNTDASATAGTATFDAGTDSLVWSGNLAIGATVTVTASVTVKNPDPGNLNLKTVVTSPASGSSCPVGGSSTTCVTEVSVLVPGLTLTKVADGATTVPGSVVHYTITATNTGQTAYAAASFADALSGTLDDATYNSNVAATTGAVSFSGSTVSWTGALAIGATATITYSVTVKQPDPGDKSLTGRVASSTTGSNCPTGGTDARCASPVTVLIPSLHFASSLSPADARPGDALHYSLTVHNDGQTPYSGLRVTLNLDDTADDSFYNYDATITTGDLVTNPDGTVDWVLDLAPGASATGTISLTVNDPDLGDKVLHVVAVSTAPGSPCAIGSADHDCVAVATVLVPGLTITKTANLATATPGDTVEYQITVANTGETTYPAARFTDDLAGVLTDATSNGDADATSGTVSYDAPMLSWVGALAPGATATITYSVDVRDPDPGDKRLVNTVVSPTAGNNCRTGSTDPGCTATVLVLVPALTIAKTADVATTTAGSVVHYTVTATNSGAVAYDGAAFSDALTGLLDDATYNGDAGATTGTVSFTSPNLVWNGNLAIGAVATITYSVTVHAADGGNNQLHNTVTSSTRGNNCVVGNSDPRCTTTVKVARLVIEQAYSDPTTTPGSVIRLNASFTNTGQVPYTGVTISSPSANTVDDAIPTGDQVASKGALVLSSTAITWTGDIPVGGTITVTGTLTVKNPDPGDRAITGTLVSAAPGNNCLPASTDGRCTALIAVKVPELTISKSADTAAAEPGDTVGYTITVHNTGETPYVGATVADSLTGVIDRASYDGNATATSGSVSLSGHILTWSGNLAVGASATIEYTVTVDAAPTGDLTLFNAVTSSDVGSTCPPASGNTACRVTVDIRVPSLTIEKTADVTNATLGSTVTYTVTASNVGLTSFAAATFTDSLTDVLDDATYNGDAAASTGTVGYSGSTLTWTGALAPAASATITYSVTIDTPDTGDGGLDNTVTSTSTGSNCASSSVDPRCEAHVDVTNAAALTFTKTADVASTVAGGVVQYTVTAANATGAPIGADFTDPLPGILDDATYNSDVVASAGDVDDSGTDIAWTGTVPASASVTVTYSVTVNAPMTGNQLLVGTITSTSPATSNNCLADSGDPRCTDTVPVAALLLHQSAAETTATPGSIVHLTATYTNTGQVPYTGISVVSPRADTSDDTIPTGDQTATSGSIVRTSTFVTWTGDIPVGGSVTMLRTLRVQKPDPGNKLIRATIQSSAPGNNCPTGTSDPLCSFLVTVVIPELTITKTANTPFVVPGGTATYTIAVHNTGETAYTDATVADTLLGVLDDATYNGDASATAGSVSYSSPVLTWTGDLAVGASATITYSVTAHSPATADKTMINPVSSDVDGSTCPPASGNTACRATVVVLTPIFSVTSSANAATTVPGATVTYTVTATNAGQVPFGAATFSVPLAGVLDDATYSSGSASATSGAVGVTGGVLTWTGALSTASQATITYAVTVDDPVPGTGDFRLQQTVTSATAGSTCPSGGTDPRCTTSVPIASLHIAEGVTVGGVDATTAKPTDVAHPTLTFTNTGQVPYVGIDIVATFAGFIDDATYNGDAATSDGSLLFGENASITWTGDLAVGASVTVTGSLTVNNPDTGDKQLISAVTTTAAASNCPIDGADPSCSIDVHVLTPELTITKSADQVVAGPGSTIGYTITVANTGETPYTDASVRDALGGILDDTHYNHDATATVGDVSYSAPDLTWTGDLTVGATATISYSITVDDPDLGDKLVENHAISSDLGSTCPTGFEPACSTLVFVLVPRLEVSISTDQASTRPGETVGYTITVHNAGQTPAAGALVATELSGVLDDTHYDHDADATSGDVSFTSPTLTWTGDVGIGDTTTVTFTVTVDDPDTGNHSLAASVSSSAPGSACTSGTPCTNTVAVLIPGLAVSTVADRATATPGDDVVFTVTVANTGETPYVGTVVSTDLTRMLDDATVDGSVSASSGVAEYTAPTVSWTGTLPVGATATITYRVTVENPDTGNKVLVSTVEAAAVGSSCPVDGTSSDCTATVDVLIPALTIGKSADAPTTTPGGTVQYTIVLTNTGETPYTGAAIADSLSGVFPDSVYNADATATTGVLDYGAPVLTWSGDLAVGATVTITYSVTVNDPDTGDKAMTNAVTSSAPGSTCPPGGGAPACSVLVRVLLPELTISQTADRATVTAGGSVEYTVTLTNTGQTDYAPARFSEPLTGVLDDADYEHDAVASVGSVSFDTDTLVWTGALAQGDTATVTYTVTTFFPATGNHALTSTVASTSLGASCSDGCTSSVAVLVPALEITKTADASEVVAGGPLRYTITATNTGEANFPAATLTDSLTGVLDDAAYGHDAVADTGAVSYASGVLTWSGALPVGATAGIDYSVTADVDDTGNAILVNHVASTSVGSNCGAGGSDPRCTTSTPVAARSITLSGLTPSFTLSGPPNSTVDAEGAVTMTVTTNSTSGYAVSVLAQSSWLTSATPENTEKIAIDRLRVRETGTTTFQQLLAGTSSTVHVQHGPSSAGGDAVSSDYRVHIPFVRPDTYSTTLEYIASAT